MVRMTFQYLHGQMMPSVILILKQVQHDLRMPPVILNLFQDLTASLYYPFSADRC